MELTWGFLVLFVLFILPGLITRRLYYFGEFSKQFGSSEPLTKTLAYSLIPGVLLCVGTYIILDFFFIEIKLDELIDDYKTLSDPKQLLKDGDSDEIKKACRETVLPFLGVLYSGALVIGMITGRFIRFVGLDTRWKLFRFRNHWFYLFSGHHAKIKKYNHLKKRGGRYLFTNADILVDTSEGLQLYSGVIVDYEVNDSDCQKLTKLILKNPSRYKKSNMQTIPRRIPGNLLVVECSKMVNINLTYVYGESKELTKTIWPKITSYGIALISILVIPLLLFFKVDWITWETYTNYFNLHWFAKFFYYLFLIQLLQLVNPFVLDNKEKKYKWFWSEWQYIFARIIAPIILFCLAHFINRWLS